MAKAQQNVEAMKDIVKDVNLYDQLRDDNKPDYDPATMKDRAIKNLSLRLLDTSTAEHVMAIFESEFMRRKNEREPHGEELAVTLKFLQQNMQTMDMDEGRQLLNSDVRISVLVDWLMARYEPLDFEYKVAVTFALGYMLQAYDWHLSDDEHYKKLVEPLLDYEVPSQNMAQIPSMVMMIPTFSTPESAVTVMQVVERLSSTYFVHMSDRLDLLACAQLAMGWTRSHCRNEDLINQMVM